MLLLLLLIPIQKSQTPLNKIIWTLSKIHSDLKEEVASETFSKGEIFLKNSTLVPPREPGPTPPAAHLARSPVSWQEGCQLAYPILLRRDEWLYISSLGTGDMARFCHALHSWSSHDESQAAPPACRTHSLRNVLLYSAHRTKWQLHAARNNCVLPATAGSKDILGMQSSD